MGQNAKCINNNTRPGLPMNYYGDKWVVHTNMIHNVLIILAPIPTRLAMTISSSEEGRADKNTLSCFVFDGHALVRKPLLFTPYLNSRDTPGQIPRVSGFPAALYG